MKNAHLAALAVLLTLSSGASAYKQSTHILISERAARQSVLDSPASGVLADLGLGSDADDPSALLPSTSAYTLTLTPMRLIERGADDEDLGKSSTKHFFDPQQEGHGLRYLVLSYMSSPEWSLEVAGDVSDQEFSYLDAQEYLRLGLLGSTEEARNRNLGKMFESLGHVIHHVQDMAQPQHVRNDIHCDEAVTKLFESSWLALPLCPLGAAYRPSAYEDFTARRSGPLPLEGYGVDYGRSSLPKYFWENGGAGIAEFTSRNFVSAGTNFREEYGYLLHDPDHPRPDATQAAIVKKQITDPDLLGPQGPDQPLSGEIWFIATPVIDQYLGLQGVNERASTYSIFDKDLQEAGATSIFTLNRFNYAAANDFLLPRATAYSTGLINYFFRGRIEIGLPEQGVYGVVDHATTYAAGQGFSKLKLRLRNASPDGVTPDGEHVQQTMQGGTLVAVAKYTLNSCYQPDLTGDYAYHYDTGEIVPPASCSYEQYIAGEEQIAQSTAIVAASLDTAAATDFTFDFSSQPIPIDARDLRIQVVYTGTLGSEPDAIAFGGRDISEPTYVVVYNNSDYFSLDGKLYTPAEIRSDPAKQQRVQGLNIDPVPLADVAISVVTGKPLTELGHGVPVNGYVRLALLADRDAPLTVNVLSRFQGAGQAISSFPGVPTAVIDLRSEDGYITALGIYRAPRSHFVDACFKANSSASISSEELTLMSARAAADPGPTPIPLHF